MSNAWLNVRLGLWHLIIGERWVFSIRISRNAHHIGNPKRFQVHHLRPFGFRIA